MQECGQWGSVSPESGSCCTLGVNRNVDRTLVVKTKEERFLERPKHKLYDNTKMDLKEIGTEGWAGDIWLRDKRWAVGNLVKTN